MERIPTGPRELENGENPTRERPWKKERKTSSSEIQEYPPPTYHLIPAAVWGLLCCGHENQEHKAHVSLNWLSLTRPSQAALQRGLIIKINMDNPSIFSLQTNEVLTSSPFFSEGETEKLVGRNLSKLPSAASSLPHTCTRSHDGQRRDSISRSCLSNSNLPSKWTAHPCYSIRSFLPYLVLDCENKPNVKTVNTKVGCSKGGGAPKGILMAVTFNKGRTHILMTTDIILHKQGLLIYKGDRKVVWA